MILTFPAPPKKEGGTLTGQGICLQCRHTWLAVVPLAEGGLPNLECPKCGVLKGVFLYPCRREEEHWVCLCGCELFSITKEMIYCRNCGIEQTGY